MTEETHTSAATQSMNRLAAVSKQLDDYIASSPRPDLTARAVERECEHYGRQYDSDLLVLCRVLRGRGIEPVGGEAA